MKHLTRFVAFALVIGVLIASPARSQLYEERAIPTLALSNTAVTVKSGIGVLLFYSCFNPNTAAVFVQFWDSISAITVGTTKATLTFTLQPGASGMRPVNLQTGAYVASTGMQVAATTTATGGSAPTTALNCDWVIR